MFLLLYRIAFTTVVQRLLVSIAKPLVLTIGAQGAVTAAAGSAPELLLLFQPMQRRATICTGGHPSKYLTHES